MKTATWSRTTDALASMHPITTVARVVWQSLAPRPQRRAAAAPEPVRRYGMLVPSDVYRGVHGLLP